MWKKNMNRQEAAQAIERFLEGRSLYPQEWNDFVDTPQEDSIVESYRQQCHELDPLINRPGAPDPRALNDLKRVLGCLRSS